MCAIECTHTLLHKILFEILIINFYLKKTCMWLAISSHKTLPYHLWMITQIFKEFQSPHMKFMHGFSNNFVWYMMKGVDTLIKIKTSEYTNVPRTREHNPPKKDKIFRDTTYAVKYMCCICKYLLYFEEFAISWCLVCRYLDSYNSKWK